MSEEQANTKSFAFYCTDRLKTVGRVLRVDGGGSVETSRICR